MANDWRRPLDRTSTGKRRQPQLDATERAPPNDDTNQPPGVTERGPRVWLKTSDDFPDYCARAGLSDAAYRTHHEGLSWTMRRETGGSIDRRDVRRFAETLDPDKAIAELCDAGFWRPTETGWQIIHAMDDQIEPEVIARRREKTRERVRKHRRKAAGLDENGNAVTEGVTDAATRRVTRDGSGLVGTGREPKNQTPALEEKGSHDMCRWCSGQGCPQCDPDEYSDLTA